MARRLVPAAVSLAMFAAAIAIALTLAGDEPGPAGSPGREALAPAAGIDAPRPAPALAGAPEGLPERKTAGEPAAEPAQAPIGHTLRGRVADVLLEDGAEVHVVLGGARRATVELLGNVLRGGEPLPSGRALAYPDGEPPLPGTSDVDIEAGRFRMTLPHPGDYTLLIESSDVRPHLVTLEVPDVPRFETVIRLPTGSIAGTVRLPGGDPADQAAVLATREGDPMRNAVLRGMQAAHSGPDGAYAIDHLAPGRYTVDFGAPDGSGGPLVVSGVEVAPEATTELDVDLPELAVLAGRAVGPDGRPARDAEVFVQDASGRWVEAASRMPTFPNGQFHLFLAAGEHWILARSPREASRFVAARVEPGVDLAADPRPEPTVELVLEPATLLRVALEDAGGRPVPASFRALDEDGRDHAGIALPWETFLRRGWSRSSELVGPLPSGTYRIEALAADGRRATAAVEITGGEAEREIVLQLD